MYMSVESVRRWASKGGLGILDQGLYSGANFILSVLLARWLSPEMYGGFSAAYSMFLLISTAQVALLAEPMSIFGAHKYRQNIVSYLNYLLRIQWVGSLFAAAFLFLIALLSVNNVLRNALISMAVALPFILFYWYLRRAFYIETQSGKAAVASLAYSSSLILVIFLLRSVNYINSVTAYAAIALSSVVASILTLKPLCVQFFGKGADEANLNSEAVGIELWNFGKWILSAFVAGWFASMSYPFLITILLNAQSAGVFRAVQNLFLPFQQILAAITLLVLPWLARQKASHGEMRLFTVTQVVAWITGIIAVMYCLGIVIFRREIMMILYANEFYSSFDSLVIYLAICTLLGSVHLILGLGLRVVEQLNPILWSKGSGAIFAILIGIPMIREFRMSGVLFSLFGSAVIEAFILLFYYFKIKNLIKSPS
jgi:O-antigen/teichoic acid export membrane protein